MIGSNGFASVRALLTATAPPPSSPVTITSNDCVDQQQAPDVVKAKKRAAFEAWHRRKLDQINGQQQQQVSVSIDVGTAPVELHKRVKSEQSENLPCTPSIAPCKSRGSGEAKHLTAPKLSRHNDAAYYPNIQCILCKEWVCSRNRYMHIESHLQYRPYKCSICGYDNRKEIFINLHIKRTHGNSAKVVYKPDPELEHRAWIMAEQCLQHTREILTKSIDDDQSDVVTTTTTTTEMRPRMDGSLLARYAGQFRPRIFNSQRAEKSQLIEESRQLGLVPDFSEVASREAQCSICEAFVLSHQTLLEEHVRTHLSSPSYRCTIDGCCTEHHSKNFLTRHMKEVHKYRRAPFDLLEGNASLIAEYVRVCTRAFPDHFGSTSNSAAKRKAIRSFSSDDSATLCQLLLATNPTPSRSKQPIITSKRTCSLCRVDFVDTYTTLYAHVKTHLSVVPYECRQCRFSGVHRHNVEQHITDVHHGGSALLENRMNGQLAQQCHLLMAACFPEVILQPWLHDTIESQ